MRWTTYVYTIDSQDFWTNEQYWPEGICGWSMSMPWFARVSRWWFQRCVMVSPYCTPKIWGNDPSYIMIIWPYLTIFFKMRGYFYMTFSRIPRQGPALQPRGDDFFPELFGRWDEHVLKFVTIITIHHLSSRWMNSPHSNDSTCCLRHRVPRATQNWLLLYWGW